eukprot:PhM_4_TR3127/c0_g1_i1/m.69635
MNRARLAFEAVDVRGRGVINLSQFRDVVDVLELPLSPSDSILAFEVLTNEATNVSDNFPPSALKPRPYTSSRLQPPLSDKNDQQLFSLARPPLLASSDVVASKAWPQLPPLLSTSPSTVSLRACALESRVVTMESFVQWYMRFQEQQSVKQRKCRVSVVAPAKDRSDHTPTSPPSAAVQHQQAFGQSFGHVSRPASMSNIRVDVTAEASPKKPSIPCLTSPCLMSPIQALEKRRRSALISVISEPDNPLSADANYFLQEIKFVVDSACSVSETWKNMRVRGVTEYALSLLQFARDNETADLEACQLGAEASSSLRMAHLGGHMNHLHSFASALALKHVATSADSLWQLDASVIFVDVSGYSRVASLLGDRGLHIFASVVNAYLETIVSAITEYGGDVVKFAGDAIMAMWYSSSPSENTMAAISCAFDLLESCGSYPIPGEPDLTFGLHIGISAGSVVSEVFAPRTSSLDATTPTHFHYVTGDPVTDVAFACEVAKRDEVVMTAGCVAALTSDPASPKTLSVLPEFVDVKSIPGHWDLYHVVSIASGKAPIKLDSPEKSSFAPFAKNLLPPRVLSRIESLESDINPLYLTEMRDLIVLFISSCASELFDEHIWFDEVFATLTSQSCSVVQIINDDKGIHVVAAFNLYMMLADAADMSIFLCRTLRAKHLDCHVGVAVGPVLCGFLGARTSCQWDITGPACVRACRLMQHAKQINRDVVLDTSIYDEATNRSELVKLDPISIKGSDDPVPVFSLKLDGGARSSVTIFPTTLPHISFNILCPAVHSQLISTLCDVLRRRDDLSSWDSTEPVFVNTPQQGKKLPPCLITLTGGPGCGKYSVCQNALRQVQSGLVPIVHTAGHDRRHIELDVLNTIAMWLGANFQRNPEIKSRSTRVQEALRRTQLHIAYKLSLEMLEIAMGFEGFRLALIVRCGQFLDCQSISFLRGLAERYIAVRDVLILVTCTPQFSNQLPQNAFMARWGTANFEVTAASSDQIRALVQHELNNTVVAPKAQDLIMSKSGGFVDCVIELLAYMQRKNMFTYRAGMLSVLPEKLLELEHTAWDVISVSLKRRCVHQLDHLPLNLVTMAKIVCAITEQPGISAFFYSVNKVCERMLGHKLRIGDIETLQTIHILRLCEHKCTAHTGNGELDAAVFYSPAMRDVCQSMLMTQQRTFINKTCATVFADTHPMDHPLQYLVRARHRLFSDNNELFISDFVCGWNMINSVVAEDKREALQNTFMTWAVRCSDFTEATVSSLDNQNTALSAFHFALRKYSRVLTTTSLSSLRSPILVDESKQLEQEFSWVPNAIEALPLSCGPLREVLRVMLHNLAGLNGNVLAVEVARHVLSNNDDNDAAFSAEDFKCQHEAAVRLYRFVRSAFFEYLRHLQLLLPYLDETTAKTVLRHVAAIQDRELGEINMEIELSAHARHYRNDGQNPSAAALFPQLTVERVISVNRALHRHISHELFQCAVPRFVENYTEGAGLEGALERLHSLASIVPKDTVLGGFDLETYVEMFANDFKSGTVTAILSLYTSLVKAMETTTEENHLCRISSVSVMMRNPFLLGRQQRVNGNDGGSEMIPTSNNNNNNNNNNVPSLLVVSLYKCLQQMYDGLMLPSTDQQQVLLGFIVFLGLWCEEQRVPPKTNLNKHS